MKKQRLIGITLLVTAALLLVSTGAVIAKGMNHRIPPFYAEEDNDKDGQTSWGPMHGYGGGRRYTDEISPMKSAMIAALAENSDLSNEEINAQIADGEHLLTIVLNAGLTEEAFFDLMADVREDYFARNVEEGWMPEEQYQWMLERMGGEWDERNESFPCHSDEDGFSPMFDGSRRGRGNRW